jgi:predicted transcriptional regulator
VARKERVPVRKNLMNVAVDAHVGLRVRGRRMVLGISQMKLADALGVTFQQVQKYEKGSEPDRAVTPRCDRQPP